MVDIQIISAAEADRILTHELPQYHHHGPLWAGALQPSFPEYFLLETSVTVQLPEGRRNELKVFMPEGRIWRFWYVFQLRLPLLNLCVRKIAPAQIHSAAAERAGSLFTHDKTSQMDASSNQTAVIRQLGHYQNVVDPMQNMPLSDLAILQPL